MRNKSMKRGLDLLLLVWGILYYFYYFYFGPDNDLSWHSIRPMFGVPYTAKEHMHDTSAYYTKQIRIVTMYTRLH